MSDSYSLQVADPTTLPGVAALVGRVHGAGAEALTLSLARHFPEPVTVLWLRHDPSGAVASTLSLIPWTWRMDSTLIPVWETGIVATDETHRGKGLSTRLMDEAQARRREAGVMVSIIQGIPCFYRRYGYEFAVPLETHIEWELRQMPGRPAVPDWTVRPVGQEATDQLQTWFADAHHQVASVRRAEHWRYRLTRAMGTETETRFFEVKNGLGLKGGFGIATSGFGDGLIVNEVGGAMETWPAIAAELRAEAERCGKPLVRLHLGAHHPFGQWAKNRGARFTGSWHWQIKFDDPQRAFDQTREVWQARWPENLPNRLVLDLFNGHQVVLTAPHPARCSDVETRLSVPRDLLPPLLFGWKPLSVLRETRPDLFGSAEALALVEALFPPRAGFCPSPY